MGRGCMYMRLKYGLVRLSRVIKEYKGVLGHSSLTMSLVDALGRARKRWDCARQRSPNAVKGEMRQGLTLQKGC
jgi:hypothetical protein